MVAEPCADKLVRWKQQSFSPTLKVCGGNARFPTLSSIVLQAVGPATEKVRLLNIVPYVLLFQIHASRQSHILQWVVVHPGPTLLWFLPTLCMSTSTGSGTWCGRPSRPRRSAEWRRNSSLNDAAGKPSGSSCRRRSAIFTRSESASWRRCEI